MTLRLCFSAQLPWTSEFLPGNALGKCNCWSLLSLIFLLSVSLHCCPQIGMCHPWRSTPPVSCLCTATCARHPLPTHKG